MNDVSFPTSRRSALLKGATLLGLPGLHACTNAVWSVPVTVSPPLPAPALRLLGETTLPYGFQFKGSTVGGLSALAYDAVDDLWYALSDDRSDHNPTRFYTLRMRITAQGLSRPELQDVVFLTQADGSLYPNRKQRNATNTTVPNPEGLCFRPQTRTLLWSSEGDRKLGLSPFVREMALDGKHLRELDTPAHLKILDATNPAESTGPRDNLGLEGLALSPDGNTVWAAMESPLLQDGPIATVSAPGGPCRFTGIDLRTGKPIRQIAYQPDAIPLRPFPPGSFSDNGVSEILMQSADHMLVLERCYSFGMGNSLRIYRINVNEGSDTLNQPALTTSNCTPAPKTLVVNFNQTGLQRTDNTEGMAWGPLLPGHNGNPARRNLVCVSDDNFNPLQITQFVAFEVTDKLNLL